MHSGCGETHTHVRETMHTQVTINVRLQPYKKTPARPSPTTNLRLVPTDENIPATIIEINNSVQQATADTNKAIGSTRVPHDDGNTNETKLAINDDVIILHEDISPVCNPNNPWMFKNTNCRMAHINPSSQIIQIY
ncbi:hypothetical protein INT45_013043 [Circinella minor]|uniref:Uncharacterized protein n=1 Tax=Circinella minor TaxID=1195481 RepID=A0A8H7VNA0_9FUNG|nr:hypothetical protein INT45_013043 [Circinella minor]